MKINLFILAVSIGFLPPVISQEHNIALIKRNFNLISTRVTEIQESQNNTSSNEVLDKNFEELSIYNDTLNNNLTNLNAAISKTKSQLDELGPIQKENEESEKITSTSVYQKLNEEIDQLTELKVSIEFTKSVVNQLLDDIENIKRSLFRENITKRQVSIYSFGEWKKAIETSLLFYQKSFKRSTDWWNKRQELKKGTTTIIYAAISGCAILFLFLLPYLFGWKLPESKFFKNQRPEILKIRMLAIRAIYQGFIGLCIAAIIYWWSFEVNYINENNTYIFLKFLLVIPFFMLILSFSRNFFSPRKLAARIANCATDPAPKYLHVLLVSIFLLYMIDRFLILEFEYIEFNLDIVWIQTTISSGVFLILLWMILSPKLWYDKNEVPKNIFRRSKGIDEDNASPNNIISSIWKDGTTFEIIRKGGRYFTLILGGVTLLAYVNLTHFIFQRLVFALIVGIFFWSLYIVTLWQLTYLLNYIKNNKDNKNIPLNSWLVLLLKFVFGMFGIPVLLLMYGYDWVDVQRILDLNELKFNLGAVSISFYDIISSIVIFFVLSRGIIWSTKIIAKNIPTSSKIDSGVRNSLFTLVKYVGFIISAFIALSVIGIDLSSIAVIAGALSVGIGFGLRDIVNNFVSGLILLFERPIKNGDWIIVPSGQGLVKHIGVRATEILTFDKSTILIPNAELISAAVENWFYKNKLGRIKISVGVSYSSDPERVRELLIASAKKHPDTLKNPKPLVIWKAFGESSLDFELLIFVKNYENSVIIRSDLHFEVFKTLEKEGIVIPFPQRDLNIKQEDLNKIKEN